MNSYIPIKKIRLSDYTSLDFLIHPQDLKIDLNRYGFKIEGDEAIHQNGVKCAIYDARTEWHLFPKPVSVHRFVYVIEKLPEELAEVVARRMAK